MPIATRPDADSPRPRSPRSRLALAGLLLLGCGCAGEEAGGPTPVADAPAADGGGLSLPPGYQTVDKPLEVRKQVYADAHRARVRALAEANKRLPMDDAHMPKDDKPAFDKRMAEHKAILDEILERELAAVAEKHGLTVADIARVEDEAGRLRWTPPAVD